MMTQSKIFISVIVNLCTLLYHIDGAPASAAKSKTEPPKPAWFLIGQQVKNMIHKEIPDDKDIVISEKEFEDQTCKLVYKTFVIKHPRCITEEVVLPVCYGQCNSIYLPGNTFKDTLGLCQSCQPTRKAYKLVVLKCPDAKHKKIRKRKIEYFKECACKRCG
uniref:CTCK domain-containing protein n=1 Tax=Clytia hemisphaerica TaxID=252671 RepID=A0A7M5WKJ7_9CNID